MNLQANTTIILNYNQWNKIIKATAIYMYVVFVFNSEGFQNKSGDI